MTVTKEKISISGFRFRSLKTYKEQTFLLFFVVNTKRKCVPSDKKKIEDGNCYVIESKKSAALVQRLFSFAIILAENNNIFPSAPSNP